MKKYIVTFYKENTYEIEANTEQEAQDQAYKEWKNETNCWYYDDCEVEEIE